MCFKGGSGAWVLTHCWCARDLIARVLIVGLVLAGAVLFGAGRGPGAAAAAQQREESGPHPGVGSAVRLPDERLNVVFILADDLGWGEVGCFGQEKIPTPHLDRLAREGMRLTCHYSGAPVCAPSRCVLLTGMHLGHAEIRGNQQAKVLFPEFTEGQHPLSGQAITFPRLFREAGYDTAAFGKWGLGPVGSTGDPQRQGFDLFFGYNCQAVAHSYYPPFLWRNNEQVRLNDPPVPGHFKQPEGEVRAEDYRGQNYAPARMVEEAERFLLGSHDRPFLLYLPFIEPHVAMHPPAASVDRFPAEWDQQPYRGESGYLPHDRPRAAYAAMISDLDSHVGRVLQALDRTGLSERTLVIFSSDNGTTHEGKADSPFEVGGVDSGFFRSTGNLQGFKGSVYEGGLRVPTIVRLPGVIEAGSSSAEPGYFADWFPTLCEACRIQPPVKTDGTSLWPLLSGQGAIERTKPMVWVFPEYGGQVAVRWGDRKVLRRGLAKPKPGPWEVYDLAADPGEKNNLAASEAGVVERAIAVLRQETDPNPVFPLDWDLPDRSSRPAAGR